LFFQVNVNMSYLEVASLTSVLSSGERVIEFKLKKAPLDTFMYGAADHRFETAGYPLLFSRGEDGWGKNLRKELNFIDYLAARMLQPEIPLSWLKDRKGRFIHVNRFNVMSRLGSYAFMKYIYSYAIICIRMYSYIRLLKTFYVCICIHTYAFYVYICVHTYVYNHMYTYIICMHMYTHLCIIRIHMYTYICIHTYVYIHMYTYIICMYTYVYILTSTYI
jgi:hypothetical protein